MSEWVMSPGERAAYANGYEHGRNSLKAEIIAKIEHLLEVINDLPKATEDVDGKTMDER